MGAHRGGGWVSARNCIRRIISEGRGLMQLGWAVAGDGGSYAHDVKKSYLYLLCFTLFYLVAALFHVGWNLKGLGNDH